MKSEGNNPLFFLRENLMISEQKIKDLVEEKIVDTSFFIVDVKVGLGNKVSVELDGDQGITIDDCVSISRHIESSLDREEEDFALQVSSAGLDRPLRHHRQYLKNIGREVELITKDGNTLEGVIKSANDQLVLELPASKKKKLPAREEIIVWENVKETRIVISFK
ncbi:MAG: ribosome assembly cofactor RimP [Salibacteraceae bacterium]|jgi:ribosome maturation factor RimP|nr:ribosome assembly cofactor RimP [Salibacteraceae bacterium]MDP4934808.1 ribosome assembly cofactor RimP [Salibacteraceae bacterium]